VGAHRGAVALQQREPRGVRVVAAAHELGVLADLPDRRWPVEQQSWH